MRGLCTEYYCFFSPLNFKNCAHIYEIKKSTQYNTCFFFHITLMALILTSHQSLMIYESIYVKLVI